MDNSRAPATSFVNSPDSEETPSTGSHPNRSIPFSNGLLRRYQSPGRFQSSTLPCRPAAADEAIYKECLKNHAAAQGGLALDGCGGYIASLSADPANPITLKCMVCNCHRNFHRCEKDVPPAPEFVPFNHQPAPLRSHGNHLNPNSAIPLPHHFDVTVNSARPTTDNRPSHEVPVQVVTFSDHRGSKKRFRTKFSNEQKEKMLEFAEQLDWKMRKTEEDVIEAFCGDIGVERSVLKVWMHNNKGTLGKRSAAGNGVGVGVGVASGAGGNLMLEGINDDHQTVANGSSSSSFEN